MGYLLELLIKIRLLQYQYYDKRFKTCHSKILKLDNEINRLKNLREWW